ncbi:MATE family efflux transporter [Planotetraspora silvatica]|uniref:Probable multidrug resistance protein NorM n=1 Tax=Planotetraspora silvatica TaxID=234614 RepID=A0A8J3UPA2_9ACTN|nr:MATE family efflux transporter [Planotetraspora silvatica]GII48145.1 MATE family efflux transporter [Planotetraspora silvatica]
MGAAEHRRRLVSLAYPVYFELLAGVAAGIINMVWVVRLGGDAVAAVAVATNVENLLLGVILVAGSGTTVLVARARGAEDPAATRSAVRGGWTLWALVTPVVAIGGYLCREPLARLVLGGGDGDSPPLAADYFSIALPGIAVFFATNVVDGILKGLGDTRTPMRLAVLANGLILVLDPLFILRFGLGVRGAAIATVSGRTVALACGFVALRRNGALRRATGAVSPRAGSLGADARRTAATGLPMSADFAARMTGALALVAIVARIGVSEVAAYGIATKAMYVATMAFYAVRQAAAIHTAHLLGAGRDERRVIGRQALLLAGTLGLTAMSALLAAGPWIMRAFGSEGEVAEAGALYLRCLGPYLVLLACFIALGGVFEGSGDSPALARITTCGVVLQLALAYGLSGWGLPGVCAAMALSTAPQCAAIARMYRRTEHPGPATAGELIQPARAQDPTGLRPLVVPVAAVTDRPGSSTAP